MSGNVYLFFMRRQMYCTGNMLHAFSIYLQDLLLTSLQLKCAHHNYLNKYI